MRRVKSRPGPWSTWIHMLQNDDGTKLVPASQWYAKGLRWKKHITEHIVEHKYDANLGLPPTGPLNMAQKLFVALPDMDRARDFPNVARRDRFLNDVVKKKCAAAVFDAETKALKRAYVEALIKYGDVSPECVAAHDAERAFAREEGGAILDTQRLVSHLSGVVGHLETKQKKEKKETRARDPSRIRTPERLVDASAMKLAELCGFGNEAEEPDGSHPFEITTKGTYFELGGWEVEAVPDIFIVRKTRGTDDLVIVFEDKSGQMSEGGIAQLLGEMLLCHYHNHYFASDQQKPPRRVFAVRLYDVWASMYSLEASAKQVRNLCKEDKPFTKMMFTTSIKEPWSAAKSKCGANLLVQSERSEFIHLMAKLRHHLVR
uniref:Uncharacterized protein n=1 Tax=Neobodo designis TaxID=312471 RepID=A0A7S1LR70_NEODS|mmetsp:Transcript_2659/g.8278  ORF Transcript_2659/g.8278 Transcript_2659/m.8278 type:complete len:375 (+) Transcript_2659:60-1184(+)